MIFLPSGSSPSPSTREVRAALSLSHLLFSHTLHWERGSGGDRVCSRQGGSSPDKLGPGKSRAPTATSPLGPPPTQPGRQPPRTPRPRAWTPTCPSFLPQPEAGSCAGRAGTLTAPPPGNRDPPRGRAFWRPRGREWGGVRPGALQPFRGILSAVRGGKRG